MIIIKDDFLGAIRLNLTEFVSGAKTPNLSFSEMRKNKINLFERGICEGWWPFFDKYDKHNSQKTGKFKVRLQVIVIFSLI